MFRQGDRVAGWMDIDDIIAIQEQSARQNIHKYREEFLWCSRAVSAMWQILDSLKFEAEQGIGHRDEPNHKQVNVTVALIDSAFGDLCNTLRLISYGAIASSATLIRVAFEAICLADYFRLQPEKVGYYLEVIEKIERDRGSHTGLNKIIRDAIRFLDKEAPRNQLRKAEYAQLSVWGGHASPLRCQLNTRVFTPQERVVRPDLPDEKVTSYDSLNHTSLETCITTFANTCRYAMSIPFVAWPYSSSFYEGSGLDLLWDYLHQEAVQLFK